MSLSLANRLSQLSCLNKSVKTQEILSSLMSSFKAAWHQYRPFKYPICRLRQDHVKGIFCELGIGRTRANFSFFGRSEDPKIEGINMFTKG